MRRTSRTPRRPSERPRAGREAAVGVVGANLDNQLAGLGLTLNNSPLDGVLIDSEYVGNLHLAEYLTAAGTPIVSTWRATVQSGSQPAAPRTGVRA